MLAYRQSLFAYLTAVFAVMRRRLLEVPSLYCRRRLIEVDPLQLILIEAKKIYIFRNVFI